MKKFLILISLILSSIFLVAQNPIVTKEAENGVLTGTYIAGPDGASSGQFVTGFDNTGDKVEVTVNVPTNGSYNLVLRYRSLNGDKTNDLYVNGSFASEVLFSATSDFVDLEPISLILNEGDNKIAIVKNWGYFDLDMFSIFGGSENNYNITSSLYDSQVNSKTQTLYDFIRSQYGSKIMTGQTSDFYADVVNATGKNPLVRGFDLYTYSPMYPYKWDSQTGTHTFGAVDNGETDKIINWYTQTGQKGIVEIHWHWPSPSGGQAGTNTFYTTETTFDVSKAVIPGTTEYNEIIRDIDTIALELKRISDAGIPIIWRPLHEAGGGWFWWGAKGAEPCLALYDILQDRLTNVHNLHNIIWCWSTPEVDWYPGNSKVDILGFDSYPGEYNYTIQKSIFDILHNLGNGTKIVAMTENGPIPELGEAIDFDARWSFFVSWNDLVFSQNTTQHIIDMYNHPYALTIENCPTYQTDTIVSNTPPSASFNYSVNNLTVSLDGSSSVDSDGNIIQWYWDFGDGNTGYGETVNHTYTLAGDYLVSLVVTDNEGETGSEVKTITIESSSSNIDTMHVESAYSGTENAGAGYKHGVATVTITDQNGINVSNAIVSVTFSGTFNETVIGTTDDSGTATIYTTNTARGGITVDFCIDNVEHIDLLYNNNKNNITCTNLKSKNIRDLNYNEKGDLDNAIRIYPNPARSLVVFDLNTLTNGKIEITITDIRGNKIDSQIVSNLENYILNVEDYHQGVYFIKFIQNEQVICKKLVVE
jgi:mannan endo-1,4-beta-mannosidase